MPLNPVVAAILEQAAAAGAPPLSDGTPAEGRAMYQAMNAANVKVDMAQVEDLNAGGVPVRVYRSSLADNRPCLMYFHGGGWVIGDLETHDNVCRHFAKEADCTVIAVDYRLAPEHPFPAPVDDCYNATCWVQANAASLKINPQKMAVAGDSAGGHLSAVVSLRARDENGPQLVHQLLIYPVTDAAMDTVSYTDNAEGYMLTRDSMRWFWDHFAAEEHRSDPLASPLRAESVAGTPPATVITAEFDPLRDEGEAYGKRLQDAGVPVHIKRYDGMVHGFVHMLDALEDGRDAMLLGAARLREAFGHQ
ncbi:MAG: alpha/beta hydrolase [Pseudomonadales bacterium]|nr:alpha/beta hydrolase [Pseudomonadales bacterium]